MIQPLPPPTTFAEGQRQLFGLLMAAAGVFCGCVALGLIAILVWGNWPSTLYGQIVTILGLTLGGFIMSMSAVIIAMAVGGPVGKFSAKASKDGFELGADGD